MVSDQGWKLVVWIVVFTFLTLLTLALRFWAIQVQRRPYRLDDWFILVAFAGLFSLEGTTLWAVHNNLGAHTNVTTYPEAVVQQKLLLASGATWTISTVFCKLAVLWLYNTIFTTRTFKKAVYFMMGLTGLFAVVWIPVTFTHCSPPSAAWSADPAVVAAKCRPISKFQYASVGINMGLDLAIVMLPLPIVWRLQMPTRKKIFVSLMFCIGLLIVGITAWRIQDTVVATKNPDWNYGLYLTALLSHLEIWLGILAANFPTIVPLISHFISPKVKTYFKNQGPTVKQKPITIGSAEYKRKRDNFSQLDDTSTSSYGTELLEVQRLNKVEVSALTRSISPHVISRQREVEVSVESGGAQLPSHAFV